MFCFSPESWSIWVAVKATNHHKPNTSKKTQLPTSIPNDVSELTVNPHGPMGLWGCPGAAAESPYLFLVLPAHSPQQSCQRRRCDVKQGSTSPSGTRCGGIGWNRHATKRLIPGSHPWRHLLDHQVVLDFRSHQSLADSARIPVVIRL